MSGHRTRLLLAIVTTIFAVTYFAIEVWLDVSAP